MTAAHRTVLWDLDGTLVGLRKRSFKTLMPLTAALAFRDLTPPHRFLRVLSGVLPEVRRNETDRTNTEFMVDLLADGLHIGRERVDERLRRLAEHDFVRLRRCFPALPEAVSAVRELREAGVPQIVATNPLWPLSTATTRLRWGGHDPGVFEFITSGETMRRSKPRVEFYRELLDRLGLAARDCVMIGNDAANDAPAARIGIPVFLLGVAETTVPQECSRTGLVTTGDWTRLRVWLGNEEKSCSSS
ncbi:HAD family hydrolase [Nocardia bhagyanarayanae]|uniref:FMN phosphatase YigB (HAD superfamily) n=1 Tax=Nocardia bhagyanarayanae TaxID=1215925 RepID=A0A543FH93_9NOCA|nr:HAD family hydrolase [Nocardia bhagyanarayanae]TQM33229.1 FMN phosphatase YigB (HAD superfamily) [Nocardia bhagyanarayanae]